MAYDTYEDDLLRRQSADVIGAKLDAARKARALQNNPQVVQGKVNPLAVASNAASAQGLTDLETQYRQAVGNPGAATGAILNRSGQIQPAAAVPALQMPPQEVTPPVAPRPAVPVAQAVAAPAPVATNLTPPVDARPVNGTPVVNAPVVNAPALAAPPAPTTAPITRSVDAGGRVTFSGTGTPGQPSLSAPPAAVGLDPGTSAALSAARSSAADRGDFNAVRDSYQTGGGTFQGTTAGQDKLRAMAENLAINPSRANRRSFAALQAVEQGQSQERQFGQSSKLARDQLGQSSLESNARIETGRKADERAAFTTQVAGEKQNALRTLASGQHSPEQEAGLRMLAGLSDKWKTQVQKGDPLTGTPDTVFLIDEKSGQAINLTTKEVVNAGAGKQTPKPMEQKPPAGEHKGKIISGPDGRFKSDGKQWVKVA